MLNVTYEKASISEIRETEYFRAEAGDMVNSVDADDAMTFETLKYSKDLFVVWTTFCRARGPMKPEIIANAIKELVQLQQYLQEASGAGVKFIFIATNVPSQWIPDAERLVYEVDDMSDDVANILGGQLEPRFSWVSPQLKLGSSFGKKKDNDGVELNVRRTGDVVMSPIAEALDDPDFAEATGRPTLFSAMASTPEQTILRLQNREESWVSFRYALTSKWKKFQDVTYRRIAESISLLNSIDGPDCTTLFVPEHESDVETLKEFKYSAIYDEVNRCIIDSHLKYQKNPIQFLRKELGEDGDPLRPSVISCDVLYSGDYASSKLDSLKTVVQSIASKQRNVRVPAALNFVPDA